MTRTLAERIKAEVTTEVWCVYQVGKGIESKLILLRPVDAAPEDGWLKGQIHRFENESDDDVLDRFRTF